jgi:hypothetical protein
MMRFTRLLTVVGAVLIVLGIVAFANRGVPYRSGENVIDGNALRTSVNTRKIIPMSPLLIGLVLVGGAALIAVGSTRS